MKAEKLIKLINAHCPTLAVIKEWGERVKIQLADGGEISVAIEDPNRACNFPFLYFNIRFSKIRLERSDKHTGKFNYFKSDAEQVLIELLKELNTIINP